MEHVPATTQAVSAVVVTCAVGVVTANRIPAQRITSRDLSMMVTSLCVPALLFAHLSEAFTVEMLSLQSATLLVLGAVACFVGAALGLIVGRVTLPHDPELAFLTMVGCAFQNTVILPLGLISSLDVHWLKGQLFERAAAYVFVYSVITSLIMWTVGQEIIKRAGEKANGIQPPDTTGESAKQKLAGYLRPLWSGPFIATIAGVACGVAGLTRQKGPLQYPLHAAFTASSVIGDACIPTSLILLGVNLRNSAATIFRDAFSSCRPASGQGTAAADAVETKTPTTTVEVASADGKRPTDGAGSSENAAAVASASSTSAAGPPPEKMLQGRDLVILVLSMSVTRLVIVPAVVMALFHFVARQLFPVLGTDPAMIIVLFVESSAPTAIACSLLFTVHNMRPAAFAQAIFFQYVSVAITAALWLAFTLWYIESTTDVLQRSAAAE